MYTAREILRSREGTSRPRVKKFTLHFYNLPAKGIDAGLSVTRQSLPTESRRTGGFRRFILAHSRGHLRHSSPDDSNFNSITRTQRSSCAFSYVSVSLLLFFPEPFMLHPHLPLLRPYSKSKFNYDPSRSRFSTHTIVRGLSPSRIIRNGRKVAQSHPFLLPCRIGSRKVLEILKSIKYYH